MTKLSAGWCPVKDFLKLQKSSIFKEQRAKTVSKDLK